MPGAAPGSGACSNGGRVLFDVSGLVQWYAYLTRPSGVQRVSERILGVPALAFHPDVRFVARAIGSDAFYVVDPAIVAGLTIADKRRESIARLRRLFGQSMRLSRPARLVREMRAIHLPYLALGWTFTNPFWEGWCAGRWPARSSSPRLLDPADRYTALVGLGDFWCHAGHVDSLIRLKRRHRAGLVHLVHDLTALDVPGWSHPYFGKLFAGQFSCLAPEVDRWLVTSRYVAGQLERHLADRRLPTQPLQIMPMGWPAPAIPATDTPRMDDAILRRLGLRKNGYILHVGTVEPRKNLGTLLDALTLLAASPGQAPLPCVLAGRDGWRSQAVRRRLRTDPHLRATVRWLRDASDRELSALYRGARLTVLPSFDEGWGLPVQESLAHGTPCIASAAGGIPEAGLDLAKYVKADSASDLARAIGKFAMDDHAVRRARAEIAQRLDRSTLPSWHDSAATLASLVGLTLASSSCGSPARTMSCGAPTTRSPTASDPIRATI